MYVHIERGVDCVLRRRYFGLSINAVPSINAVQREFGRAYLIAYPKFLVQYLFYAMVSIVLKMPVISNQISYFPFRVS